MTAMPSFFDAAGIGVGMHTVVGIWPGVSLDHAFPTARSRRYERQ